MNSFMKDAFGRKLNVGNVVMISTHQMGIRMGVIEEISVRNYGYGDYVTANIRHLETGRLVTYVDERRLFILKNSEEKYLDHKEVIVRAKQFKIDFYKGIQNSVLSGD